MLDQLNFIHPIASVLPTNPTSAAGWANCASAGLVTVHGAMSAPADLKPKQKGKFRPKRGKASPTGQEENSDDELDALPTPSSSSAAKAGGPGKDMSPRPASRPNAPRGKVTMGALSQDERRKSEQRDGGANRGAASSSSSSSSSSLGAKGAPISQKGQLLTKQALSNGVEEIVGVADSAPLRQPQSDDSNSSSSDSDDFVNLRSSGGAGSRSKKAPALYTYDDDAVSDDDATSAASGSGGRLSALLPPRSLDDIRYEPRQLPLGRSLEDFTLSQGPGGGGSSSAVSSSASASPHIFLSSAASLMERQREENSLLLFKLPTRLPTVSVPTLDGGAAALSLDAAPVFDALSTDMDVVDAPPSVLSSSVDGSNLSASSGATAFVHQPLFDDSLRRTPAGQYGKLLVYKSGRAVLVVGGGDTGLPETRFDVDRGLQCKFKQQAVVINNTVADGNAGDDKQNDFVEIGDIAQQLVVTPQLDSL